MNLFYIILALVVLIVGLVVIGWAAVSASDRGGSVSASIATASIGTAVVFLVVSLFFSVHTIDTGKTGLVYQFGESGKIIGHTSSGYVWTLPWHGVRQVNTQTQKEDFPHVVGFSSETQEVDLDVALNYHINPASIDTLYTKVGPNWFKVLVTNRVLNDAKEQTVTYRSIDVAPNREKIRHALEQQLTRELGPKGIIVDGVSITNIGFSTQFTQAIENKQQATQNAQAAQARVAQKQAEARQAVAEAEGQAQATLVRARAQSEANRLLALKLSPQFIDYQRVLALQALAKSGNLQLVPSDTLLQLPVGGK